MTPRIARALAIDLMTVQSNSAEDAILLLGPPLTPVEQQQVRDQIELLDILAKQEEDLKDGSDGD